MLTPVSLKVLCALYLRPFLRLKMKPVRYFEISGCSHQARFREFPEGGMSLLQRGGSFIFFLRSSSVSRLNTYYLLQQ